MKTKSRNLLVSTFRFVVVAFAIYAAMRFGGVEHTGLAILLVVAWFAIYAAFGGLRPLLFGQTTRAAQSSDSSAGSVELLPLVTGEFVLVITACIGTGLLLGLL